MGSPMYNITKYFANILRKHTGKTSSQLLNSSRFVSHLWDITIEPINLMTSFDESSLFTNVPISDTMVLFQDSLSQGGESQNDILNRKMSNINILLIPTLQTNFRHYYVISASNSRCWQNCCNVSKWCHLNLLNSNSKCGFDMSMIHSSYGSMEKKKYRSSQII